MTYEQERALRISGTVIDQMGGSARLKCMVGANNFFQVNDELGGASFRFKGSRKSNSIKVTLMPSDTYKVDFYRIGKKFKKISTHEGVYCDMLKPLFEAQTGLYLSL